MKLHAAIFNDTDGYTYNSEIVLGIFATPGEADEYMLKMAELNTDYNGPHGTGNLENYHRRDFEVGEPWVQLQKGW